MKNLKLLVIFNLLFLLIASSSVMAATEQPGIKVAPATVNLIIDKNDTEKIAWVGIKNNYSVPITITAELMGVDQEGGNITPTKQLPDQLKNNLTLDKNLIKLDAGESINIRLAIVNASKLLPGGNYASLVLKQANENAQAVGLQPAVSVSIFITKTDGIKRDLKLESTKLNRFLWSMPKSVTNTFVNDGNIMLVPRGRADIINNNNVISTGLINESSSSIFPANKIALTTKLKNSKFLELPGKKNLIIAYRYDGSDEIKYYKTTFLYIPFWVWIILITSILFIVIFLYKKPVKKTKPKSKKINIKVDSETTIFRFK